MALADHWPLFGLRVTTPRLELRSPTDDDLAALVEVAAEGVHAPDHMPFVLPWTDTASPRREWDSLRYWWGCRANLTPEQWDLALAVVIDGHPIGVQSLGASNFVNLRSAETGSWLGRHHHGQGIGREMRTAMLHLAFEHLGALEVISSAFPDNQASRRVSEAVGYEANGVGSALRRGERAELLRFRLTAERWWSTRPDLAVEVTGFEPCRALFGLD